MICDVCSPVAQAQKLKAFIRGETLLTAMAFVNHWMGAGVFRVRVDGIFSSALRGRSEYLPTPRIEVGVLLEQRPYPAILNSLRKSSKKFSQLRCALPHEFLSSVQFRKCKQNS
jgi:hypothetical protein